MHNDQVQLPVQVIQHIGALSLELYFAKQRIAELEARLQEAEMSKQQEAEMSYRGG